MKVAVYIIGMNKCTKIDEPSILWPIILGVICVYKYEYGSLLLGSMMLCCEKRIAIGLLSNWPHLNSTVTSNYKILATVLKQNLYLKMPNGVLINVDGNRTKDRETQADFDLFSQIKYEDSSQLIVYD